MYDSQRLLLSEKKLTPAKYFKIITGKYVATHFANLQLSDSTLAQS